MKPTKTTVRQRVEEILQIKLDGAQFFEVRRYVAEKEAAGEAPWTIPEGGKPVSERTLWRYSQRADRLMAESSRESRKKALQRHIGQRHNMYAKALNMGDVSTALRVLADMAALQDLYPAKKSEVSGKGGGAVVLNIIEEVVGSEPTRPENVIEEVVNHDSRTVVAEGPTSSGTAGLPPQ